MRHATALSALPLLALVLAGCPKNIANPPEEKSRAVAEAPKPAPPPAAPAAAPATKTDEEAKTIAPLPEKPVVELETSMGKIKLELFSQKAPKTVANFLEYVRAGHYAGTIFHRVIPTFMIQGGGFDANMSEKPTREPIPNEADNGLSNERGTIAMARTPNPHSASAQFFINVNDNPNLNHREKSLQGWGYCVFGKVTEGMAVVDKIKAVPTGDNGPHANVPTAPVLIKGARLLK